MDGLEHVQRHMQLPADEQEACVRDFWEEVGRPAPCFLLHSKDECSGCPSDQGINNR
jgi:hypothetical protein